MLCQQGEHCALDCVVAGPVWSDRQGVHGATLVLYVELLGNNICQDIEHSLLHASGRILTQHTVDEVVQPTLDKVLRQGRADIVSVGFLIALWSGSSSMATFVNTITIAYGQRDQRSADDGTQPDPSSMFRHDWVFGAKRALAIGLTDSRS